MLRAPTEFCTCGHPKGIHEAERHWGFTSWGKCKECGCQRYNSLVKY